MARAINSEDEFKDKLLKIIPSEIIAAYLTLQGLLAGQNQAIIYFVITALTILTYFYLKQIEGVRDWKQKLFSVISFPIWVYAVAPEAIVVSPFSYNPALASIILVLWTLLIPLVLNPEPPPVPTS